MGAEGVIRVSLDGRRQRHHGVGPFHRAGRASPAGRDVREGHGARVQENTEPGFAMQPRETDRRMIVSLSLFLSLLSGLVLCIRRVINVSYHITCTLPVQRKFRPVLQKPQKI
jgi:hypothetical protein